MEPGTLLRFLQEPTACHYPEPDQSAPGPQSPYFLQILFNKHEVRTITEDV
jgi:hypothetical protein